MRNSQNKSILIFGAGKIGRSFIGQVFGRNGYQVVFSDVNQEIIHLLQQRESYTVEFKSEKEESFQIDNVSAIHGKDQESVVNAITETTIAATCVGKNALIHIIPFIAKGLEKRYAKYGLHPLDIILAENLVDASAYVFTELQRHLPADFPLEKMAGLIETSIGKMVPIMPESLRLKDPLLVYAEPYNTLIVDKRAFLQPIPELPELAPKENITAWVERKAFIHNLGHATVAYTGFFRNPGAKYIWEVLEDDFTYDFSRQVMQEAAGALLKKYPWEFTRNDLENHIDDLLMRFKNQHLGDTIFRVGMDLPRKLGSGDRFLGAVSMAKETGTEYSKILKAYAYGLFFKACDENSHRFFPDEEFTEKLDEDFDGTIQKVAGISAARQPELYHDIKSHYLMLKKSGNESNGEA